VNVNLWWTRPATALGVVAACTLALTACGGDGDSDAARAARAFAGALAGQDAQVAADLTTSPTQASEALGETFAGMHPKTVDAKVLKTIEYTDGTASFTLQTTWHWSDDRSFESKTSGSVRRLSSGWKVQWEPGLLHSGMPVDGHLQMVRTDATPAPTVRSATGKTFMQMEPVNQIVIDPAATKNVRKSVNELAAAIKPIAPLVTASVINDKLVAAQGGEVIAVTLRDPDMKVLASDPSRIKGVSVRTTGELVMSDRRLSSPLSAGLTNYWQAIRDATAGWQVQLAVPGAKPSRLAGEQGKPGPDVMSTVNMNEQLTLGDTVVEVAQPATMMTLDARSGAIRAMAQNSAAAERKITADVAYPTGSTLDPVFSSIDENTDTGQGDQPAKQQMHALGLGLSYTVPGVAAPRAGSGRPKVATAAFHPQNFSASMLSMGALGVSLARSADGTDSSVAPFVIKGAESKVSGGELGAFDPQVAKQIVAAMRTTARTGDASDLTGAPGLYALVGTNGPQGPGWFVGVTGNTVMVIYCEGEKSGTAALQVAQKYFRTR